MDEPALHDWDGFYQQEHVVAQFAPEKDPFCLHRCRAARSVLPKHPIATLLDVGCGDGFFCEWIRKEAGIRRVVGLDTSTTRIALAKERYRDVEFLNARLPRLPFKDGEFEAVTLIEVLEHLPEPVISLREIARVASRWVVITVPDRREPATVMCPHCLKLFPLSGHLHYFDPEKLREVVTEAGLTVEQITIYRIRSYAQRGFFLRGIAKLRDRLKFAIRPQTQGKFLACRARK